MLAAMMPDTRSVLVTGGTGGIGSVAAQVLADAGVSAVVQPGGSIRDKDSIEFCKQNGLVMVITGMRHFKH